MVVVYCYILYVCIIKYYVLHITKYSSRNQNITKADVFAFILFSLVIVDLQQQKPRI